MLLNALLRKYLAIIFFYFFFRSFTITKRTQNVKNTMANEQPDMQLKVRSDKVQDAGKTEGRVTPGLVGDLNNIRCRQE